MTIFQDPKHWRERAAEARRVAETMTNEVAKQGMLKIAADYEKLVELTQKRVGKLPPLRPK